jgi:hypothetical protein
MRELQRVDRAQSFALLFGWHQLAVQLLGMA